MSRAARSVHGPELDGAVPQSATVVAFPLQLERNTLRPLDRIETLRWAQAAQGRGYSKVDICDDEGDPEIGHFVLIYEDGREWASWGVSRESRQFSVWRPGVAGEVGRFETMRDALDGIFAQPRDGRRKLPIR